MCDSSMQHVLAVSKTNAAKRFLESVCARSQCGTIVVSGTQSAPQLESGNFTFLPSQANNPLISEQLSWTFFMYCIFYSIRFNR